MSLASEPLPTDPDELRLFAAGLQAELARKEIEIAANAAEIYAKALHIGKRHLNTVFPGPGLPPILLADATIAGGLRDERGLLRGSQECS